MNEAKKTGIFVGVAALFVVAAYFVSRPPAEVDSDKDEATSQFYPDFNSTEKAKSEFIIAPVLAELKRLHRPAVGVFSGVELSVDPGAGLTGTCDFLLSLGPEQFFVKAPIVALVEAKKEDMFAGIGQCARTRGGRADRKRRRWAAGRPCTAASRTEAGR